MAEGKTANQTHRAWHWDWSDPDTIRIFSDEEGTITHLHRPSGMSNVYTDEWMEETARLIAAAPDLLREVRMLVIQCPCGSHADEIKTKSGCHRCRSAVCAIANTEGEKE